MKCFKIEPDRLFAKQPTQQIRRSRRSAIHSVRFANDVTLNVAVRKLVQFASLAAGANAAAAAAQ